MSRISQGPWPHSPETSQLQRRGVGSIVLPGWRERKTGIRSALETQGAAALLLAQSAPCHQFTLPNIPMIGTRLQQPGQRRGLKGCEYDRLCDCTIQVVVLWHEPTRHQIHFIGAARIHYRQSRLQDGTRSRSLRRAEAAIWKTAQEKLCERISWSCRPSSDRSISPGHARIAEDQDHS